MSNTNIILGKLQTETLQVTSGATTGYVLTSDVSGNTSWNNLTYLYTGNTSGNCISDLYVSNLYGCSPVTIHNNLAMITGTSISSTNGGTTLELDPNNEPNKLKITSNSSNPIATIYMDSSTPNGVVKVLSNELQINLGIDVGTIYTGVTTITNTGIGTGLTLNVSYNSNVGLKVLEILDGGYGYVNGDSVIVLGSDIGGTTPADNQNVTVRVVKKPNDIFLDGSNVHFKTYGDEAELGLQTITEFKLNSDYFWEPTIEFSSTEVNGDRASSLTLSPNSYSLEAIRLLNSGGPGTMNQLSGSMNLSNSSVSLSSVETNYDLTTRNTNFSYVGDLQVTSGVVNISTFDNNSATNSIALDIVNSGGIYNRVEKGNFVVNIYRADATPCNNNPNLKSDFIVTNNLTDSVSTCDTTPTAPTIISSQNSTVLSGITNSVILGGTSITAATNNTVYTSNLNINTIGSGTSVFNLGLDSNGFVVTGTTSNTTLTASTSVINFSANTIFGTYSSPLSTNLTDDLTNSKLGVVQKIYHNSGTAPTVPVGWVLLGSTTYQTSTLNIIYAEWSEGTRVEYWIVR